MEHMEDGELVDTMSAHGEKRDHSLVEEEIFEETLSIKPPPVKKHKRHHKKHKNGKEEKKKKRRNSGERNHKSELNKRSPAHENGGKIRMESRRVQESVDPRRERNREDGNRLNERLQHRSSDKRSYSNDRTTQKYSNSGNSRDQRDFRDSKFDRDRNYTNNSNTRARPPPHRHDIDRKPRDPGYRQKPIEDARGKINQRREEAKSKAPLLVRQFDNDEYRPTHQRRENREERGKHDRSVSSSILLTSHSNNSSAPSRRSDTSVSLRRQNDRSEEAVHRLTPDMKTSRRDSPRKRREERLEMERKMELNAEVISSEDSSGQSDSSSESESDKSETERKENNEQAITNQKEVELSSGAESEEEEGGEVKVHSSSSSSGEEEGSSSSGEGTGEETEKEEEVVSSGEEGGESGASKEGEEQKEEDPRSRFDSPSHPEKEEEEKYEEMEIVEEANLEEEFEEPSTPESVLPFYFPAIQGCRSVDEFQCLNRVEEGTYGVVYRAKDKRTDQVVALKRLKMEKEREGFPITSLREVSTLLKAHHPNVVGVQEIVVGSNVDKIYIVMEYVEHDLKTLMETMKQPFLVGEVKTIMIQLLRGIHHLHDNWILHRDLKTSNLLLSHKGILKIADFGLAREYGSPLKPYTPIVVTLWYRPPELLLGAKEYSTAVDMWSVGCIFAELLSLKALFPGRSEIMQLNLIFKELGSPSEKIWPGYNELPIVKKTTFAEYPYNTLRKRFGATELSDKGFDLLNRFLTYCPAKRISSLETLKHEWFNEKPKPVQPSMFPTWPAKSEQMKVKKTNTEATECPKPPAGAMDYNKLLSEEIGFQLTAPKHGASKYGTGFSLQF